MRSNILYSLFFFTSLIGFSQLQLQYGPELEEVKGKMNRVIGTDEDGFYCYRVYAKGDYAHLIIEKYGKSDMNIQFIKEIKLDENDLSVEEIKCVGGVVYVFISQFNRKSERSVFSYWKISGQGKVDSIGTEIISLPAKNVDYDVVFNSDQTKLLIKACYKISGDSPWITDFTLFNLKEKVSLWTKSIDQKLKNSKFTGYGLHYEDIALTGLYLDDKDNVYYGHMIKDPGPENSENTHTLFIGFLKSEYSKPKLVELNFEKCKATDLGFLRVNNEQLLVGGFLKGYIEKEGKIIQEQVYLVIGLI
ncbi:MAG: hypothetical protein IPJ32_01280 [Sphingobacteriaceae bacterium]|nr:hypothetical protein [Sphingobacteriaceae bacterium]